VTAAGRADTLTWRRATNLAGIESQPDQETAMQARPTTFTGSFTKPQAMPCSDESGFQLRFRSLFREGRGYSFPCDAQGKVDMDQLSERARLNYFFARALVGRDLHVPEVVRGGLHGGGAGEEDSASRWPEPSWRRSARKH
jgi:hypothetical protein